MCFVRSQGPWPLTFSHQILISSSVIHDGHLYQIWRLSPCAFMRYGIHKKWDAMKSKGPSPLTLGHQNQFILKSEWTSGPNPKKSSGGIWDIAFTRFRRIACKHNASSHGCRRHRCMRINSNYTNSSIQMLSVIHCSMFICLYQRELAVRWSWGSSTMPIFVFGHECVHPGWDVCVCVVNIAPLRREWEKKGSKTELWRTKGRRGLRGEQWKKTTTKRNKEDGSNRGQGDEYENKKITSWG